MRLAIRRCNEGKESPRQFFQVQAVTDGRGKMRHPAVRTWYSSRSVQGSSSPIAIADAVSVSMWQRITSYDEVGDPDPVLRDFVSRGVSVVLGRAHDRQDGPALIRWDAGRLDDLPHLLSRDRSLRLRRDRRSRVKGSAQTS